jgi:hypothetical protein
MPTLVDSFRQYIPHPSSPALYLPAAEPLNVSIVKQIEYYFRYFMYLVNQINTVSLFPLMIGLLYVSTLTSLLWPLLKLTTHVIVVCSLQRC